MLQDLINKRYSARQFNKTLVESEKLDYILDCAVKAPSKQSHYPYKIVVLEDNKEIKDWLYWEHTWTVEGKLASDEMDNRIDKYYNPQLKAPVVLVWIDRPINEKQFVDNANKNLYATAKNELGLVDSMVSASFAMLAAEEQELQTCFTRCFDGEKVAEKLGYENSCAHVMLSIGYATPVEHNEASIYNNIYKGDRLSGKEAKNIAQGYPINYHPDRRRKPQKEILIQKEVDN